MKPEVIWAFVYGSGGVVVLNFLIYLVKNKIEIPEHVSKRVEEQTAHIEELKRKLSEKEGAMLALNTQLNDVQAKYVEAIKLIVEIENEGKALKHQIERLEARLSAIKEVLLNLGIDQSEVLPL